MVQPSRESGLVHTQVHGQLAWCGGGRKRRITDDYHLLAAANLTDSLRRIR